MRAKTKRAKIAKNRAKSERRRYISKENVAMGLEQVSWDNEPYDIKAAQELSWNVETGDSSVSPPC